MSSLNAAMQQRQGTVARERSFEGGHHRVLGFVDINGAGEGLVDIQFPVSFREVPAMSFGGELGPNEVLKDGKFPTVSVMVKSWATTQKNGATYWVGATLIIVSTGSTDQKVTADWQAEGRALVNPYLSTGSTDDAI